MEFSFGLHKSFPIWIKKKKDYVNRTFFYKPIVEDIFCIHFCRKDPLIEFPWNLFYFYKFLRNFQRNSQLQLPYDLCRNRWSKLNMFTQKLLRGITQIWLSTNIGLIKANAGSHKFGCFHLFKDVYRGSAIYSY